MRRRLDPDAVATRLARLKAMAFASSVADRLEELRALDDLTRYLHDRAMPLLRGKKGRRPTTGQKAPARELIDRE
jgi:hypothetical protein